MADTRTRVIIELEAQIEKARQELDKFAKKTQQQLDSINFKTTVSAINAGFEIAQKAAQVAAKAFDATVGEAIKFEAITRKLGQSMRSTGDFSEEAVRDFVAFADALEDVTGVQDEVILNSAQLAKNFNLANSEAKAAVTAAIDLAAATGDELGPATEKVARTFAGFVDKDLAKLIPALKSLTKEQLTAGEGARLIAERFKGAAEAAGSTAAGEINKFKNALSDLGKEAGFVLLPTFTSLTTRLNAFVKSINDAKENSKTLQAIFKSQDAFANKGVQGFGDIQRQEGAAAAAEAFAKQKARERELAAAREKAAADFESVKLEIAKAGLDEVAKVEADFAERRRIVDAAARTGVIKTEAERIRLIAKLEIEESKKVFDARKLMREKEKAETAAAASDGINALLNRDDLKGNEKAGAVLGIASNAVQGEAGAKKLVGQAGGAVADSILPGSGGVATEIINALGEGPEKVDAMVTAFVQSIPKIITNVLKSIPTIIIALLREIPKALIDFIVNGVPEIIVALVEGVPQIITGLVAAIPEIVTGLITGIVEGIPDIITGFVNGLINAAGEFVNALIDAINPFSGGDGDSFLSGIPIIGDIADAIGLAEGGRVPDLPQFKGDRFPARLDAGEQVLSRDLSSRLEEFLSGGGGGGGGQTIVLQVGSKELARVLVDINERGFRTA